MDFDRILLLNIKCIKSQFSKYRNKQVSNIDNNKENVIKKSNKRKNN